MNKTIKAISTKRYEVELKETAAGNYVILHYDTLTDTKHFSELVNDYKAASFLFDVKVEELEGN